ncbi:GMC oxidoreductase [Streptomyces geranii]|uniref:GMC oxidoreductase n=1 Tax=Streptomyces geranii TaxID=2058923 RepID=UPI000D1C2294
MVSVVVVGGGLSGLEFAVALQLSERYEIILLEWGSSLRRHHEQEDSRRYPGDQRTRTWQSLGPEWRDGSGVKRRLGGRSLCWHGVVLPIEDYALAKWPEVWRQRLWRDGLYSRTAEHLGVQLPSNAYCLGQESDPVLAAVPQASAVRPVGQSSSDSKKEIRSVYSPIHALETSRVRVVKGARVNSVSRKNGALFVDFTTNSGLHRIKTQLCVLAAGAVENARIVCDSMGEPIEGRITDHLCVGVVSGRQEREVETGAGKSIRYLRWSDLRCNVFVQDEFTSRSDGIRRIVDVWALVEQDLAAGSPFFVSPAPDRADFGNVSIGTHVSIEDHQRLQIISRRLDAFVEAFLGVLPGNCFQAGVHYHPEPAAVRRVISGAADHLHYRVPLGGVDHEAGTLPIGGPVNAELGLKGFDGVYVLGPGVFPASGAANPSLTSLALSNWLARHLMCDS